MSSEPLVSICIPNYNYAQYLTRCFDSVLSQTYDNIEVIFSDNNSTDDSFEIAIEYRKKFASKNIYYNFSKNKFNVGSDQNTTICRNKATGKYLMYLSSDDALKPSFIEKCVSIMEKYPNLSMVMTNRDEIDKNDHITKQPPFFNKSFICKGEDMAAIFMLAGIAVPSQILLRKSLIFESFKYNIGSFMIAGDWYANFKMACVGQVGYLKEALVEYRVHAQNETNDSEKSLLGVFEHYQLLNTFVRIANMRKFKKPQARFLEGRAKLSSMCLRYAHKMLSLSEDDVARRYLAMAQVFDPEICHHALYDKLHSCLSLAQEPRLALLAELNSSGVIRRSVSYDPPSEYTEINEEAQTC
ncbi:glycosyltransferase family 2 protein [uncultured Mailhella sp.]|uniref:glycosyltransferase family 2 protein n=1 Tax=uncultured Mailhella sp. TaxID=1981031 RepID=UPI0026311298|nr:glycosyltransferase family 2 protein [uncultured Mailhella sp.]